MSTSLIERRRIDVHTHYIPEVYREAALAAGHSKPDGMPAMPRWSADENIRFMDERQIETALLSVSSPGVNFGDAQAAARLARAVNRESAELRETYPGRFGFFASVTLPDVETSVEEAVYALDELGADGVVLFTNNNGQYLGDDTMRPLFEVLSDRHAKVFVHPTAPACGDALCLGRPAPIVEFLLDTTRAISNLILSGTLEEYPDCTFIMPHAGGAIASIADRVAEISSRLLPSPTNEIDFLAHLRSFYYDLAGFPVPRQLLSVLGLIDTDHLLFGSDWPFTAEPSIAAQVALIESTDLLTDNDRRLIDRTNALALFPRYTNGDGNV
jgi:predicted TIM-barrel fold metal-dependent hydrolase